MEVNTYYKNTHIYYKLIFCQRVQAVVYAITHMDASLLQLLVVTGLPVLRATVHIQVMYLPEAAGYESLLSVRDMGSTRDQYEETNQSYPL
jgi:hypothetical protein